MKKCFSLPVLLLAAGFLLMSSVFLTHSPTSAPPDENSSRALEKDGARGLSRTADDYFDADGQRDLVAGSAAGEALQLMKGDGPGGLGPDHQESQTKSIVAGVLDPKGSDTAPLDPAAIAAIVAGLPRHSIPLTIDLNDGYTFSGATRTHNQPPGSPMPPPPFTPVNGSFGTPQTKVIVGYSREIQNRFFCSSVPSSANLTRTILTNIPDVTVKHSRTVVGAPQLVSVRVIIPGLDEGAAGGNFDTDGYTKALPFDANFNVSVTVRWGSDPANTTSASLTQFTPPNADTGYMTGILAPVTISGAVTVDVSISPKASTGGAPAYNPPFVIDGGVQVPLTGPGDCPNDKTTRHRARVELNDMLVVLDLNDKLVGRPTSVTVTPDDPPVTIRAYSVPTDANGIPILGPNNEPDGIDDNSAPAAIIQWITEVDGGGTMGTLSNASGPTTLFTPALPAGTFQKTGRILGTLGADSVSVPVTVNAAPVLVVSPANVTVQGDDTVDFTVVQAPVDANGNPDLSQATPVPANWSASGNIGTVSPTTGSSSTTLMAARNSTDQTGQVTASFNNKTVAANVTVRPKPVLVVSPANVTVQGDDTVDFTVVQAPVDANGNPDLSQATPVPANWSVTGNIGSVSPTTASSTTTLTAANVAAGAVETGQVIATMGTKTAAAGVTVEGPASALLFSDSTGQEVSSVSIFAPAGIAEVRISALQQFIRFLERLIAQIPVLEPLLRPLLDLAVVRLQTLVPTDARYTISGPDLGIGDVPATLTSVDAAGDPIETFDLTLRPGSPVRSRPLVPVRAGRRIASGEFGGIIFVAAQSGGSLRAQADNYADATVAVTGAQTSAISLEAERMFSHGLPLAADASVGDTQLVVRATNARELLESLDTLAAGVSVLPFDARTLRRGQLAGSERTIVATDPANLDAMRRVILEEATRGGKPADATDIDRFLRRNPHRGRVTLFLDAGIAASLKTSRGAYAGSVNAGFIGFREHLLMGEVERERAMDDRRLLIGNPNAEAAEVTVVFLLDSGATVTRTYTVPGKRRKTIMLEAELAAAVSATVMSNRPIISERSVEWPDGSRTRTSDGRLRDTEAGVKWGLAEDRTGPQAFETYIQVANAGTAPAVVRVTYLRADGRSIIQKHLVGPSNRFEIQVNSMTPELANESFVAIVESINGMPIVVERARYWKSPSGKWSRGTNSVAIRLE